MSIEEEDGDRLHAEITTRFIRENLTPLVRRQDGLPEIMVITESLLFGVMLLLHHVFDTKPHVCKGLCKAALKRAGERFDLDIAGDTGERH